MPRAYLLHFYTDGNFTLRCPEYAAGVRSEHLASQCLCDVCSGHGTHPSSSGEPQGAHAVEDGHARGGFPRHQRHDRAEGNVATGADLHRESDTSDQDAPMSIKGVRALSSLS